MEERSPARHLHCVKGLVARRHPKRLTSPTKYKTDYTEESQWTRFSTFPGLWYVHGLSTIPKNIVYARPQLSHSGTVVFGWYSGCAKYSRILSSNQVMSVSHRQTTISTGYSLLHYLQYTFNSTDLANNKIGLSGFLRIGNRW